MCPCCRPRTGEQSTTLEPKSMDRLPPGYPGLGKLHHPAAGRNRLRSTDQQGASNPGQVVAVNGNLPYSNILADGASTTLSHSQNANPATFENVSELQVNTSSFSAQYGIGGIIFNQISKGGTNRFHGTAYDFFQNDALTAHPYEFTKLPWRNSVLALQQFRRIAIGGPIIKNKMFFYFNYDQIVNHGNSSGVNSLPTDAIMGGDFTGIQTLYDPTTQTIATDSAGNPYPVRQSFADEYGNGNQDSVELVRSGRGELSEVVSDAGQSSCGS